MLDPKVISVSELNRYIAALIGSKEVLQDLRIKAEISGLRRYPSGHIYFTLKDQGAQVPCVMFRGDARSLSFEPKDGQSIIAHARAGLYERDGKFQLYVTRMEEEGLGDLHVAFEKMRQKLDAEGLFDPARKRAIPFLPKVIGVVTSPAGAVIRDIQQVLERRFPGFRLILAPAAVQGEGSALQIARGIERLNRDGRADVIIVGRGGGSLEDLWAFNEEVVARAVYASKIPVISAVGHETDVTICDYVADLRAPTPSAAAELAVPIRGDLELTLDDLRQRLEHGLKRKAEFARVQFERVRSSEVLTKPRVLVERRRDRVDQLSHAMVRGVEAHTRRAQMKLQDLQHTLSRSWERQVNVKRERVAQAVTRLDALSPFKTLARGYGYVTDASGRAVISVKDLKPEDAILLRLNDGEADLRVHSVTALDTDGTRS